MDFSGRERVSLQEIKKYGMSIDACGIFTMHDGSRCIADKGLIINPQFGGYREVIDPNTGDYEEVPYDVAE